VAAGTTITLEVVSQPPKNTKPEPKQGKGKHKGGGKAR
jgi:hypothetical protein